MLWKKKKTINNRIVQLQLCLGHCIPDSNLKHLMHCKIPCKLYAKLFLDNFCSDYSIFNDFRNVWWWDSQGGDGGPAMHEWQDAQLLTGPHILLKMEFSVSCRIYKQQFWCQGFFFNNSSEIEKYCKKFSSWLKCVLICFFLVVCFSTSCYYLWALYLDLGVELRLGSGCPGVTF